MEGPKTGPYDLISIDSIISAARLRLGSNMKETSDYDSELEFYINHGARKMSTQETFIKKTAVLEIMEGRAKLPCAMHSFLGVRPIYDPAIPVDPSQSFALQCNNSDIWYWEKDFIQQCDTQGCDGIQSLTNTCQIIGNYLVFTYPTPANLTQCLIAYKGMAVDDQGLMVLPADYEMPLAAFAAFHVLGDNPGIFPLEFQPYYGSRRKELWREYTEGKAGIQSASDVRKFQNTKYLFKRIFHALLQDQNAHR